MTQENVPQTECAALDYSAAENELCAELNDKCRTGKLKQSRTVITRGAIEHFCNDDDPLSIFKVQSTLVGKVRNHEFCGDNDTYGERDFGAFEHNGEKLFWKIDYYDPTLSWHSEDPNDVMKTVRVLTIMLASDY